MTALLAALGAAAPGTEARPPQPPAAAAEAAAPAFSPVVAAGVGAIAGVALLTLARSGSSGGAGSGLPSQSCTADDREPDALTPGAIEPAPSGQDFNSTRPAPRPTSAWLCAPRHDPEDFRTAVYTDHPHLERIGLAEAYQWGYFGEEVTIGVVDSLPEASHTAFRNRIQVESIVGGSDDESHGTEVAGVAAANPVDHDQTRPVHGVAPQAKVFGVGVVDEADTISQNALRSGVERMVARDVPIINVSLGLTGQQALVGRDSVSPSLQRAMESAYGAVLGEDSVIVHAAGNSGLEGLAADAGLPALNDDFESHFLTVTAVDRDGRISGFSNRCDGHAWCLAAPGEGVRTTTLDDGSATVSGTSFSAPMAAGAMAVTMSRFPGLTAREARVRLLESADSTGRYGDESVYGRGLLDLAAALEPIGGLALQTGGTLYEEEVALEHSAMTSSQAWGGAVAAGLGQVRTLAFDRYGGGFEVALDAGVREQPYRHDLDGWMRRHLQRPPTPAAASGVRLNARPPAMDAATAGLPAGPEGLALDALADHGVYYGLVHDRIDLTVGYASHDPDGALTAAAPRTQGLWADSVVRGPVLGLSAPVSAAHPHGPRLGLHWARLDERDGALGLRGAGGLAVDDSRHRVLGGELLLPAGAATAHFTYERVEVDVGRAGVVALDDVTAHGWGAALTLPGVTATDTVQFGFQRPVHVDGGRLSLRSVIGRDADGALSYATDTATLASPRNPARWHATYTRPLTGSAVQGRLAVGYQHDRLGTGARVDAVSAGVVLEW
ncbi:S8 family peptidase [Aquisalimonas sp. APHAB1-3]|uniref:S8 family peptidase n=2 Tax=unclassified Aquisalimonas TaxID=2644645 RepID=UPI003AAA9B8F